MTDQVSSSQRSLVEAVAEAISRPVRGSMCWAGFDPLGAGKICWCRTRRVLRGWQQNDECEQKWRNLAQWTRRKVEFQEKSGRRVYDILSEELHIGKT